MTRITNSTGVEHMATDTQFTPGPWRATFDDGDWYISGHIGRMPTIIADVQAMVSSETVKANARLIAKAPEMAALIADIEESFTADDSYSLLREACRKLLREISAGQVSA